MAEFYCIDFNVELITQPRIVSCTTSPMSYWIWKVLLIRDFFAQIDYIGLWYILKGIYWVLKCEMF